MDVSDIQKQLDMGAPIEHEHTKNQKLAVEIALQHLDEFPDYYTRLKKMEADAKKDHKKFKDVKEDAVTDLQRGIVELDDASYDSIDNLMRRIMRKRKVTAKELHYGFIKKNNQTPDTWTKKNMKKKTKSVNEGILDWFGKSESKNKEPGWVDVVDGDACAREEGETATPKCVSSEKRASMSKEERLAAQAAKRREDPNQPQKSNSSKPTMVKTDRKTRKEEMNLQEVKDKPGKGSGKKDACYTKVKSRYDVWPSAYASGALVKCRKVGAANWGNKSESIDLKSKDPLTEAQGMVRYCPKCAKDETRDECKYGQKYWDMFSMPIMLKDYTPNTPHPGNMPEEKDHEYSMARSELSTIVTAAKRLRKKIGKGEGNIKSWVQSKITKAADYIDTAADYIDSSEMKKESVSIEDANGNHYAQFIDIIKPQPLKASRGIGSRLLGESKSFNNFMSEAKKSEMKCNSPKSQPVGDSLTGKSHVVKACENGKEKLIRFGQRGVKGSPKKEGESKAYASRRNRFKTRHAKNIAKGKMSAAYWADKVKW